MIDHRFSADAFEKAGFGSAEARRLSKQLQLEIQTQLDQSIEPVVLEIIAKLNSLGHKLVPDGLLQPGDKQFRERLDNNNQHHKFLVALDVVVSVGYPDTVDKPPY